VDGAHLEISDAGREFATGNTGASKTLFDELISERTPLIKAIMWALHALPTGPFARASPSTGCAAVSSAEEARRQLDTAIVWGRYGEPFEYDAESGQLVLGSDPAKVG
jgi:NitT/TauT family transport system ATP-binding protein